EAGRPDASEAHIGSARGARDAAAAAAGEDEDRARA
ncbi:TetR/AcrR family transcriptional regulator, partial [Clavibacter michiganensis]